MSRSPPDIDFLDSFLDHVSEKESRSTLRRFRFEAESGLKPKKSSRKSSQTSMRRSSHILSLDKPVLPPLEKEVDFGGLKVDTGMVNWKRESKLETQFIYEKKDNEEDYLSDSDLSSDEEKRIREIARKASMKRRPTIALALVSSSSEESDELTNELTDTFEGRDSYAEALAVSLLNREDKTVDMLNADNQKEDYLSVIRRASRKISSVKQLQSEFPGMEVNTADINDESKDQVMGLKKFKSMGTKIKVATKLSSTFLQDNNGENRNSSTTGNLTTNSLTRKTRRAALATGAVTDSAEIKRTVEKRMSEKTHRFVLHPHSSFRFYWDLVSIIILMINVVTIPLELSFYLTRDSARLRTIKFITDVWFIMDMMLNFRTGIFQYHIRKMLEMDPTEIRKAYMKSWFVIDLIATFPFDVFITFVIGGSNNPGEFVEKTKFFKIGRVLKILALLRILRLGRFVRYLHQWEDHLNMTYGFAENMMKSFTWTFILIMVGHWNACILFLIPSENVEDPRISGNDWGPAESQGQSWIHASQIESLPDGEMYFWSLFKSMSHMLSIGYGCYTPNRLEDMWATVFVLFVGCLVFALFLSQMISLIDHINMGEKIFKRHLQEVDDYLRFNRTPVALKRSVKDFYEYHYKQRIFDEDQILGELNPLLHEEVVTCGVINYIRDCDFFRTCREDLQRKICHIFTVEMYQPFTNIVTSGSIANSFFIIRSGVVACDTDDGVRRGELYHLGDGDYFGLESFASLVNPRSVTTVMSESWVEVMQLNIRSLNQFMGTSTEYADEIKLIMALANETLKRNGDYARMVSKQREAKMYYG